MVVCVGSDSLDLGSDPHQLYSLVDINSSFLCLSFFVGELYNSTYVKGTCEDGVNYVGEPPEKRAFT